MGAAAARSMRAVNEHAWLDDAPAATIHRLTGTVPGDRCATNQHVRQMVSDLDGHALRARHCARPGQSFWIARVVERPRAAENPLLFDPGRRPPLGRLAQRSTATRRDAGPTTGSCGCRRF